MNDTSTRPDAPDTVEKGESLWVGAWYRLRKNKMALAGGVFILLLAGLWTWIATNPSLRGNLLEGFRGD